MKNIERIRAMDAEQLAGFLVENGAPVPTEFCDIVCTGEDCEKCGFLGVAGDKVAWKLWLEKDDGEPGPPDYKVIPIEANMPHKVSEVICVKCGKRWISVRPKDTLLKDIVCMNCGCGYVIETGEEMREVTG